MSTPPPPVPNLHILWKEKEIKTDKEIHDVVTDPPDTTYVKRLGKSTCKKGITERDIKAGYQSQRRKKKSSPLCVKHARPENVSKRRNGTEMEGINQVRQPIRYSTED